MVIFIYSFLLLLLTCHAAEEKEARAVRGQTVLNVLLLRRSTNNNGKTKKKVKSSSTPVSSLPPGSLVLFGKTTHELYWEPEKVWLKQKGNLCVFCPVNLKTETFHSNVGVWCLFVCCRVSVQSERIK